MKNFNIGKITYGGSELKPQPGGSAFAKLKPTDLVIHQDLAEMEYQRLGKKSSECLSDLRHMESIGCKVVWNVKREDSSSVYFLLCKDIGRIKIGVSSSLAVRIERHTTSCPFPLELLRSVPGDHYLERKIHDRFNHLRRHLEWFEATPELLQFIQTLDPNETTHTA